LALKQMLERREREYLMGKTNVRMRASVENFDVADVEGGRLEEGQTAELPRWVADELVGLNLAEMVEEPFEVEVFKAISREKMMGPLQLSAIPADFYLKMRRRVSMLTAAAAEGKAKREDVGKLRAGCYDLIGIRLSKLLSLSSSATPSSALEDRLAPEEKTFYAISQGLSKEWRAALLGGTS
jgi:GINS complex protein helical bundle domain